MRAMTGSWLVVKWAGISVAATYIVLFLVVFVRFRRDLSRLRGSLIMPALLAVSISASVPSVFETVMMARVCFVAASVLYAGGIAVLVRGLVQRDHRSLLRAEG